MNQSAILLLICGLIISGCSESIDSPYRESGETQNVPTLHLVVDSEDLSESPNSSCAAGARSVRIDCHVQSDRPVEHDTVVLVNARDGYIEKVSEVEDFDCTNLGRCERLQFVTILAGETQSKKLSLSAREWVDSEVVPKIWITLPPPHERASLLPRTISYIDATGQKVDKELLVEYPFNPYNVGSPMEIRVGWPEDEKVNGTGPNNEYSDTKEIRRLLRRWETSYESENVDAYISVFWADGFRYVSDMGTPDDTTDDVVFDDIREERESALRVFAKFRDIEIELEEPFKIKFDAARDAAEVRVNYRIKGSVEEGAILEAGFAAFCAEGENLFFLQRRDCAWRITTWSDKAASDVDLVKCAEVKRQ